MCSVLSWAQPLCSTQTWWTTRGCFTLAATSGLFGQFSCRKAMSWMSRDSWMIWASKTRALQLGPSLTVYRLIWWILLVGLRLSFWPWRHKWRPASFKDLLLLVQFFSWCDKCKYYIWYDIGFRPHMTWHEQHFAQVRAILKGQLATLAYGFLFLPDGEILGHKHHHLW